MHLIVGMVKIGFRAYAVDTPEDLEWVQDMVRTDKLTLQHMGRK